MDEYAVITVTMIIKNISAVLKVMGAHRCSYLYLDTYLFINFNYIMAIKME